MTSTAGDSTGSDLSANVFAVSVMRWERTAGMTADICPTVFEGRANPATGA
jgi:hypothetical protein